MAGEGRPSTPNFRGRKTWVPGTSPGMTNYRSPGMTDYRRSGSTGSGQGRDEHWGRKAEPHGRGILAGIVTPVLQPGGNG